MSIKNRQPTSNVDGWPARPRVGSRTAQRSIDQGYKCHTLLLERTAPRNGKFLRMYTIFVVFGLVDSGRVKDLRVHRAFAVTCIRVGAMPMGRGARSRSVSAELDTRDPSARINCIHPEQNERRHITAYATPNRSPHHGMKTWLAHAGKSWNGLRLP